MEFTERFHNPARDIGFNLAVLLTNLKEHITNDPRLEKIVEKASSLLEYFDPFLGRIEIMGSSKRVEKVKSSKSNTRWLLMYSITLARSTSKSKRPGWSSGASSRSGTPRTRSCSTCSRMMEGIRASWRRSSSD